MPAATLTVCLSIGLLYTIIAIFEGLFDRLDAVMNELRRVPHHLRCCVNR